MAQKGSHFSELSENRITICQRGYIFH